MDVDESIDSADEDADSINSSIVEPPIEDLLPAEDFLPVGELSFNDNPELSMPPPDFIPRHDESSMLYDDGSEPVKHQRASNPISPYEIAMTLWVNHTSISREAFTEFLECQKLATSMDDIRNLPKDVRTLKRRMESQLPLISQRHKMIDVN